MYHTQFMPLDYTEVFQGYEHRQVQNCDCKLQPCSHPYMTVRVPRYVKVPLDPNAKIKRFTDNDDDDTASLADNVLPPKH